MIEQLNMPSTDKEEAYKALIPQWKALMEGESDLIANMANTAAVLKTAFGFLWVGFYLVKKDELVLGPFQGPVACTRIGFGKGVCGKAWKKKDTQVVPDVHQFPGHIACSPDSRSEIVLPGLLDGKVAFVLDIDSERPGHFDETDSRFLDQVVNLLIEHSDTPKTF